MGVFQKLLGIFTSPSKTFEAIAVKPGWDWLVPAFLIVLGAFALGRVCAPKIDVDAAVKDQMKFVDKMSKGNMPAEQRAQVEEQTRKGIEAQKTPVRSALNSLFVFLPLLIVPGIYRGIAAAFGKTTTYRKLLAGYAYTWTVYLIPILLTIAIVWTRPSVDAMEVQTARLLKSNIAAFLDWDTTSKALLGLLSSVDIFDIWGFVVGSISVSKMTDFSRKGSYAVVGGVWGLYTLIKIVLGLIAGSIMG